MILGSRRECFEFYLRHALAGNREGSALYRGPNKALSAAGPNVEKHSGKCKLITKYYAMRDLTKPHSAYHSHHYSTSQISPRTPGELDRDDTHADEFEVISYLVLFSRILRIYWSQLQALCIRTDSATQGPEDAY